MTLIAREMVIRSGISLVAIVLVLAITGCSDKRKPTSTYDYHNIGSVGGTLHIYAEKDLTGTERYEALLAIQWHDYYFSTSPIVYTNAQGNLRTVYPLSQLPQTNVFVHRGIVVSPFNSLGSWGYTVPGDSYYTAEIHVSLDAGCPLSNGANTVPYMYSQLWYLQVTDRPSTAPPEFWAEVDRCQEIVNRAIRMSRGVP